MKINYLAVLCLGLATFGSHAQTANTPGTLDQATAATNAVPTPTAFHEMERGANHKLWQRETYELGPDGQVITHVHQYQELATGLCYEQNGQWLDSQELIEPYASGAIAQNGPAQIIFANNLDSEGAVDMQTPDGQRITSNILGLGYYDSSSGQAVLIAQTKDSYGALLTHNQVIYTDAFDGVKADVIYTYRKSGMEQDVILREQPPTPESLGLNSATTKLEVLTEFLNAPDAAVTVDTDTSGATVDENISWGATEIGHGRAFDLAQPGDTTGVAVEKQYVTVQGRKVLIELVPVKVVAGSLSHLPLQSSIQTKHPLLAASQAGIIPAARKPGEKAKPMKLASLTPAAKGYMLDYVTLNVGQTNFTFRGDMTYLISGNVNLAGVTTLEGGTVIKLSSDSPGSINVLGTVACQTGPYQPAIFTSADDATVGEGVAYTNLARTGTVSAYVDNSWNGEDVDSIVIQDASYDYLVSESGSPLIPAWDGGNSFSFTVGQGQAYSFYATDGDGDGSSGDPFSPTLSSGTFIITSDGWVDYFESGTPLFPVALSLATNSTLHDLRFSNVGIGISGTANYSITNAQFVNCGTAIQTENSTVYAGNILMSKVGTGFYGQNFKARVEQLTFDQGTHVTGDPAGTETGTIVALTNVLLTAVTDYGVVPVATNHVAKIPSAGIYKVVGAASHYLVTNSIYHNAGTAIINPSLLAALGQKTTYPPILYTNVAFRIATNLMPQAVRDTNGTPDYGYHYDPLDYAVSGSDLYTNMTIAAGTAIAYAEGVGGASSFHFYGLSLTNWANLTYAGTATAPCWFVNDNTVMEGGNGVWTNRDASIGGMMFVGTNSASMPQINASFTKLATVAANIGPCSDNSGDGVGFFVNSEFYNAGMRYGTWPSYYFTNCLFTRAATYLLSTKNAESFSYVNCTFYGGCLVMYRSTGQASSFWLVKNTSFDGTSFFWSDNYHGTSFTAFDYNAYNTNNLGWQTYANPYGANHGTNEVVGPHDLMATNYNWQSGWLGSFYLPPNSGTIDKGSTNADQLGLYHFTTQINQVPETNSPVDIGYHYVATDAFGNPLDVNNDGIPDYLEDANGNGLIDSGETNWALAILMQPQSQTSAWGSNTVFSVAATGVAPLSYQWYYNNSVAVTSATNASLILSNVQYSQSGLYSVVVTNLSGGTITSSNAILTIAAVSLVYTNFCDVAGLQINGTALATNTTDGCVLELTRPATNQQGSVFSAVPVTLASNASFSTFFSFRLSHAGTGGDLDGAGADGFVFVAQTRSNNCVGSTGGYMGYGAAASSVFTNCSMGVEFDTYSNSGISTVADPDGNHIGIDTNGSVISVATASIADRMNNASVWYVWVDYNGTVSNLQVRISETNSRPNIPTLTNTISASSYMGGSNVYFGFTAGTGSAYDQQDILSWKLYVQPVYSPPAIVQQPSDVAITQGSNATFSVTATGTAPLGYQWWFNTTNLITGATNGSLAVVNVQSNNVGYYSVVVSNLVGSVTSSNAHLTIAVPTFIISITSPSNQTLLARTNVTITATATNLTPAFPVSYVQFFSGTNSVGYAASTNGIYQIPWHPPTGGTDVLTALAINTNGYSAWSLPVTNYIKDLPNIQFISPTNGTVFTGSPTNITFKASVVTNWGTIIGVAFYSGTNVWLPTNNTSPYAFTWTNVPIGTHVMSAYATNSYAMVARSTNIVITVEPTNQPPFVYAGPNQTNYLSTNWISIDGLVSDDGLPLGGNLISWWTNLNGGTNVIFSNTNLSKTCAQYWATGIYVLRLYASDGSFTTSYNITNTILPTNQPPVVSATATQTVILPAIPNTNAFNPQLTMTLITNMGSDECFGLDYYAPSNCLIVTTHVPSGQPFSYELIGANGAATQFSSISNMNQLTTVTSVRDTLGGFKPGEILADSGADGTVLRIEPNGSTVGANAYQDEAGFIQTNAWVVITNQISITNTDGSHNVGLLQGAVWMDRTGVWGGDLIVSTTLGYILRINSSGVATLIAHIDTTLIAGPTTIPNDESRYGPWAGRILVGGQGSDAPVCAIDTNGVVVKYYLGISASDIRLIPANEYFYGTLIVTDAGLPTGNTFIFGIPADQFSGMVGDILIASKFSKDFGGDLYRVQWSQTSFVIASVARGADYIGTSAWGGVNFVPANILDATSTGLLRLNGRVTDDGEILPSTSNRWTVVSGSGPVTFQDATLTNTLVEFATATNYVLQLSAYDGQFTSTTNVTVQVIRNTTPVVTAFTNQNRNTATALLTANVADDGLPSVAVNTYWFQVAGPSMTFAVPSLTTHTSTNFVASNNVNFTGGAGTYVVGLTTDDGQATNLSEITVTVDADRIVLTPNYGAPSGTNVLFNVTAQLLDSNSLPIMTAASAITFQVQSGPDGGGSEYSFPTDSNGKAVFAVTNVTGNVGRDLLRVLSYTYPSVAYCFVNKDWATNIQCGDILLGQTVGAGGCMSMEWTNLPASYYSFTGTAGDVVHFSLVQYHAPEIIQIRDPAGQVVVATSGNYAELGTAASLNYQLQTNGIYVVEVTGYPPVHEALTYDLYMSCDSQASIPMANMQVLRDSGVIPNGGMTVFPVTSQATPTNILLVVTNASSANLGIKGFSLSGDFTLTNSSWSNLALAAGAFTNFGLKFNATSNGLSFGALTLFATNVFKTNYVIYLEGATYPTNAPPAIQFVSPLNNSTIFNNGSIPFVAMVNLGGVNINSNSIKLELVGTNGPVMESNNPTLFAPPDYYTTVLNRNSSIPLTNGDLVFTMYAEDVDGQSATAPPILVHIIPPVSPDPAKSPLIEGFLNGTNVSYGGTIVFPPTIQGLATNITLVITNAGTYPLGLQDVKTNGDFILASSVFGTILFPGMATNVGVIFNAAAAGTSVGALALGTTNSAGGYYAITLVGNANPPGYVLATTNTQPPVASNDVFHVQANSTNNVLYPLANDSDTNNYPLVILSNTLPANGTVVIINHGGAITYTPPAGFRSEVIGGIAYPADIFHYTLSDGHGGTATGKITVIIDASDSPAVTILSPPTAFSTNAGSTVPIIASITPSENVSKVDFYLDKSLRNETTNGISNLNNLYTNNWTALYSHSGSSTHDIDVQAIDKYGQMGLPGQVQITVLTNGLSGSVMASLESLTNSGDGMVLNSTNNLIRNGLFQLYGRAYHSLGSNVMWQLGVYTPDGTLVRNLTPVTNNVVGSSLTNGVLLTCDLTTLMNGVYTLNLWVEGGFQSSEMIVPIRLESNLKVGQFSFSQQDLVIPVSGIPLTVTRTYNSINADKGDFGYGWTYSLSDMDVSLDETRENVTDDDGNMFSRRSGGSWDVTLNLPNGQRTTFYFSLGNADSLGSSEAIWTAAPGVTAKLAALQDMHLDTLFGSLEGNSDLYYWKEADSNLPWQEYDFPGFVLTTQDGTQYIIKRQDLDGHEMPKGDEIYSLHAYGTAALSSIVDRNANTTTISPYAISFRAFNGATNQILFQRNADNLITSVSDPNGQAPGAPPAVQYQYDSLGNLINVLNLVGRNGASSYVTNSFSYSSTNFTHYITGIINADGTQVAKNFYDDSGKLTAVQDANGNLTKFIHNLTNDMEVVIDRRGCTNTYVYDPRGNIIAQTNQLGQITKMAYDINNNKTNDVMFLGTQAYATNNYVFDANNLMLSSADPLGHTNGFVYDGYGNLLASADAAGHSTVNGYDGEGNLTNTTDALGHGTTNFYGGSELLGSVDAMGTVTTNFYDPSTGYLIGTSTRDISSMVLSSNTFAYDSNGNRTNSAVWRRGSGGWTSANTYYSYDAMNRVVQTINPDGGVSTVLYNNIGKQQATIDPLGNTNTYVYDSQGRLVQTTYADLTTVKSVYDADGNRVQSIDQAGRTTTYVYDALNRLTNTIFADNTTASTIYDGVGRVAQTLDARGTITAFNYDTAGRRLAVTNAAGISGLSTVSVYGYDANGNQTTFTDGLGHVTTNVFDVLNRQVQTVYSNGTTNSTGYDAVGRRVTATNQDGVVTRFGYDGAGRLTSVTDALGQVTRYQYDEAGNQVAQIDALGRTNAFACDGMGRRVLHTRPDAAYEGFTYDYAGNLVAHTNFSVGTVFYKYDQMNRLTNNYANIGSGNPVNYSYGYTATGQRQMVVNLVNALTINYVYDQRDRLAQKVVAWAGLNHEIAPTGILNYGYDAVGNVTNIGSGYVNGVQLGYGYDALNRLTSVLSHGQAAAAYGYDLAGNLQGMKYGNGVTNQYQYDALNRLTNLVWNYGGTSRASFAYQLKPGGTRTNLVESIGLGSPVNYAWSYDRAYRLTSEVNSLGNLGYGYDGVGNRTNRNGSMGGLGLQNPSYNTNDWLTADYYDTAGNTTTSGSAGYGYDALNRLVSVGNSSDTFTNFYYDADGNRVTRMEASLYPSMTYYLVDDRNPSGYAQVVEEYQTPSLAQRAALSRVYNYGLGLISQQQFDTNTLQPATLSYYGYDGHGSVRFLMNSTNGAITDTYTYDAYGTLIASSGNTPNNYLYSGQQYDLDLKLYYNRARYLNPDTGRFLSSDSYGGNNEDPLSLHKYLYGADNPVDNTDPSGLLVKHAARDLKGVPVGLHQFLILIPDNPSDFQGQTTGGSLLNALGAQLKTVGGKQLIVVGAHNVSGRLRVKFFEDSDSAATKEVLASPLSQIFHDEWGAEAHDIAAPNGKTDTQFIISILQGAQNYIQNESNVNIPYPSAGGLFDSKSLNSNSWATSLLRFVGATPYTHFFGFDIRYANVIPDSYFTAGGVSHQFALPSTLDLDTTIAQ